MSELLLCRVCLATNVKLYDMFKHRLAAPYENLTGFKVCSPGPTSCKVCAPCSVFILKWFAFKKLCQNSQELLQFACSQNHKVTTEYIQSLDLKTEPICKLVVDRNVIKYEIVQKDLDIKEEVPISHDGWDSSDDDAKPAADNEKVTDVQSLDIKTESICKLVVDKNVNKIEIVVHEELDIKEETPVSNDYGWDSSDDDEPIVKAKPAKNNVKEKKAKKNQENDENSELDSEKVKLVMLPKEQQIEELQARKLSMNYLRSIHKCPLCYKGFMTERTFKNHMKRHDPSMGPRKCDICHSHWPNIGSLNAHKSSAHERNYICRICSHVSKNSFKAKEHIKWHNGHLFVCKICGATFKKSTSHLTHLRMHHPSDHSCDLCGESFVSGYGLKMHRLKAHRSENGGSTTKNTCETCGTNFKSSEALEKHTKGGKCQNTRACTHCGESFETESSLKEHVKVHNKDNPVKCSECSKTYPNERRRAIHYQRVHIDEKLHFNKAAKDMAVVCEICGKKCLTNAALVYHQRIHRDEKSFQCPLCPKAFKLKGALKQHEIVHTGEKPFSCEQCGKSFTQAHSMQRHVNSVHLKIKQNRIPKKSRLAIDTREKITKARRRSDTKSHMI